MQGTEHTIPSSVTTLVSYSKTPPSIPWNREGKKPPDAPPSAFFRGYSHERCEDLFHLFLLTLRTLYLCRVVLFDRQVDIKFVIARLTAIRVARHLMLPHLWTHSIARGLCLCRHPQSDYTYFSFRLRAKYISDCPAIGVGAYGLSSGILPHSAGRFPQGVSKPPSLALFGISFCRNKYTDVSSWERGEKYGRAQPLPLRELGMIAMKIKARTCERPAASFGP